MMLLSSSSSRGYTSSSFATGIDQPVRNRVLSDAQLLKDKTIVEFDFDQLVLDNHQMVRMFLARFISCPQQVDDLAQETFVAAFRQQHLYQGRSKPSTWLIGIARNKALQHFRLQKRQKQKLLDLAEIIPTPVQLQGSSKESLAGETIDRLDALRHCLGKLPQPSFELIDQFYFGKASAVTIAAQSNSKEGTIRMKLMRIRQVLQKCIASQLQS